MYTQLVGLQITSSEYLPEGSFISLNAEKIPVYVFDRKTLSMRYTGARGPIKEVRCAPDLYLKVKAAMETRKDDPNFFHQHQHQHQHQP